MLLGPRVNEERSRQSARIQAAVRNPGSGVHTYEGSQVYVLFMMAISILGEA